VGGLWRSASLYGAAYVFTGRRYKEQASDTPKTPGRIPLLHFADVADLVAHLPHGCPLVGVELDPRAAGLASFTHPPRAAYLLGAEDHGLPLAVLDRCHYLVQVETAEPESMNVACAGSVLLHHRFVTAPKAVSAS
jgi:tRNA G18 (ribose-2'-O)-methylase SpoU